MKKEIEGYLTVYLCLIMGVLLTVTFTILAVVREEVIRMEIESVMDISLFSIFGEYHKELLERYDLFSIDSGYGEKGTGTLKVEEHLKYYLNENFCRKGMLNGKNLTLTGLSCLDTATEEYCLISDQRGQVLKEAILEFMKNKKGGIELNPWKKEYEIIQKVEDGSYDMEGEWEKLSQEISATIREKQSTYQEELSLPENPADHVKERKAEGILSLALPYGRQISARSIQKENYISNRKVNQGTGILKNKSEELGILREKEYLQEYLFDKNGYFNQEKEDSYLKYQIEYLLHGEEEDRKNLEKTLERILIGREAINFAYLMTDEGKQAEAEMLATLISIACMAPELKEPVKTVILFAWSYAESVKDIRILLDGKKIPASKDSETWNTPLIQLFNFVAHLGEYHSVEEGMDYEDYLRVYLLGLREEKILMRFMDLCEMDIRFITGNKGFSMDQCIVSLKARAHISSSYGGEYQITRSWYYE